MNIEFYSESSSLFQNPVPLSKELEILEFEDFY